PEREAREPHPASPGRARGAPCSSPRAVPRTLPAAGEQSSERARNTLALPPYLVLATAARFPRPRDGLQLRTTFPLLFLLRSLLRQYNAMHHQIRLVPHKHLPKVIKTTA